MLARRRAPMSTLNLVWCVQSLSASDAGYGDRVAAYAFIQVWEVLAADLSLSPIYSAAKGAYDAFACYRAES